LNPQARVYVIGLVDAELATVAAFASRDARMNYDEDEQKIDEIIRSLPTLYEPSLSYPLGIAIKEASYTSKIARKWAWTGGYHPIFLTQWRLSRTDS
jgi:hypothetical protein